MMYMHVMVHMRYVDTGSCMMPHGDMVRPVCSGLHLRPHSVRLPPRRAARYIFRRDNRRDTPRIRPYHHGDYDYDHDYSWQARPPCARQTSKTRRPCARSPPPPTTRRRPARRSAIYSPRRPARPSPTPTARCATTTAPQQRHHNNSATTTAPQQQRHLLGCLGSSYMGAARPGHPLHAIYSHKSVQSVQSKNRCAHASSPPSSRRCRARWSASP